MPLTGYNQFKTAATNANVSRPGSSDSNHSKSRAGAPRCSISTRDSLKSGRRSTTPPGSPYDGRLSPSETRQELIERKKREQKATWLQTAYTRGVADKRDDRGRDQSPTRQSGSLLTPGELDSSPRPTEKTIGGDQLEIGLRIRRPRSALHRGDFRQDAESSRLGGLQPGSPYPTVSHRHDHWISTSPTTPWYQPSVPAVPSLPRHETIAGYEVQRKHEPLPQRQRARSYTARTLSFALQPPTSPLVNTVNNSDNDSEYDRNGRPQTPDRASRRRTFSPGALRSMRAPSAGYASSSFAPRALPNVRRDGSFPYQAHQPRRSINLSHDPFSTFVPQSPSARMRRPSLASESSPLQRAPMVGRYEESILRGRMSSLPSRPLDFVAQIGVLGKGSCKSSLRCPPHVTIPFPAVFYNYGSRPGSPNKAEDGPSPYVGMIDLDTLNPPVDPVHSKARRPAESSRRSASRLDFAPLGTRRPFSHQHQRSGRSPDKWHARSGPTGGYRIPGKGQLQIILKNPNKTAVKLFLIPYDLDGMQPGQKTFLRQRSYSAGPIIDMPLEARKNLGTDRPEAALCNSDDPKDRPVLRYLIHLNICCPAKGRFFLYKSIRVVFANRVPDGKEKLRQEVQVPDPKFTSWRPDQDAAKEKEATSQIKSGLMKNGCFQPSTTFGSPGLDCMDGLTSSSVLSGPMPDMRAFTFPVQPSLPFYASTKSPTLRDDSGGVLMRTPPSPKSDHLEGVSPSPMMQSSTNFAFERLARDEFTGVDDTRRPQSPRPSEGMLGLRLRDRASSRPPSQGL